MKTRLVLPVILFAISFFMIENIALAQQPNEKEAKKWLQSKTWNNGISQNVDPSVDAVEFYKQYHAHKALWDSVFTYLKNTDLNTIAPGKYPIDGDNAYASITEAPSKEPAKAGWESHQKYIDLQYVIKGKENIEVTPLSTATVTKPYDAAKDVANYSATGTVHTAEPSTFFLFFPNDVHKPNMKVDGYDVVKKLVIKIHMAN
ncbi:YhcH/YjgK/YiaL family protein [Mucilaginibacter jinjuensis]|uniref:YhcH/YjgK/YiaL family protein n=1 Tax=Mucilaginibacter jinjuensis TaxID=1176721 RepID=A0ABY7T5Q2_9SPHI|nr:YhcH/YjgK/YiaL family protein [Mucilaginibacter jinjuensis]WCT11151.1 YhcH/YjgK/YiaL family protein [Mucilaginibacter jinjuensis]